LSLALPHRRSVGLAQTAKRFGAVAGRTRLAYQSAGSTNKQVMAQTRHTFMDDVKDGSFRIRWPNYRADPAADGEHLPGASATARGSILYWDRSGVLQLTRLYAHADGSDTASAADGGELDFVNPAINILRYTSALVRFWGNFGAGVIYSQYACDYLAGDIFQYGAAVTDLTGTTTAFSDTYQGTRDGYFPVSIEANTTRETVAIGSDSRDSALRDAPFDVLGHTGQIARLVGRRAAYHNLATPGGMAAEWADSTKSARRTAIARRSSRFFIGFGVNDTIANGRTGAQAMEDVQTVRTAVGVPAVVKTLDPWTIGGNVNLSANDTYRQAFNALARSVPSGFLGVFDPAIVAETAGHIWVNATYCVAEGDGSLIHESNAGNVALIAGCGFDYAASGLPTSDPAELATEYPSGGLYTSYMLLDGWSGQQAAHTPWSMLSPNFASPAATLKEDGSTNSHDSYKQLTLALASTTKTFTFYAKRGVGSRNIMLMVQRSDTFTDGRLAVNLGTGAEIYSSGGTGFTVGARTITAVGSWWKIALTLTMAAGMAANPYLYFRMADASGNDNYAGDGASTVAVWGLDVR